MADTKGAADLGTAQAPREPVPPAPALPKAFQARQDARAAATLATEILQEARPDAAPPVPEQPEFTPDQTAADKVGVPAMGIKVPQIPVHVKPKPQWLTPQLAQRAAEIEALVAENYTKFMALRQLGVTIPAAKIIELKLEAILDTFFPIETRKGQYHRLEFEAHFERLMRAQIDESHDDAMAALENMKSQIRQQMLAGQIPPGMTPDQLIAVTQELGMQVPEALLKQASGT